MISAAYDWHNYGKSTIGNKSDIERVPIEKLQEFYHRHYQPENTVLTIAGKFQPKTALADIVKYFGPIPRSDFKSDNTYTEEPAQDGQRVVRLKRVGNVAVVGAAYHIPAAAQQEFSACEVLEGILSDDPSGHLYKALVETKQAARVFGITFAYHDPGLMVFLALVVPGKKPEDVLKTMEATIADVAKKGVTQAEVDRIRQQLLKQREQTAANSSRLGIEMTEWISLGDWRLYFLNRDRLEKLTAADVNKAAAKYLKPDNSTLGLFLPTKKPDRSSVPPVGNLVAAIGNYKGRTSVSGGETFDASPANIDARTQTEALNGGVKAAFLAKKTRGSEVHLRLELHYGDVQNLRGLRVAADVLPDLMITGTKNFNKQQIQDTLDKLKATLHASGSPGNATFSIQARGETFPDVLKLLKEILREPTLPESELELIRQAELAQLKSQLSEPTALAGNAIRRHLAPYDKDDRLAEGRERRGHSQALFQLPERRSRRAGDRRRLRQSASAAAVERDARRLEGRNALRAHLARRDIRGSGRQPDDRNSGQGQRRLRGRQCFPHARRQSRFCSAVSGRLHPGRRHADLAAGNARATKGRAHLRGRFAPASVGPGSAHGLCRSGHLQPHQYQ
jgi:zinc protease